MPEYPVSFSHLKNVQGQEQNDSGRRSEEESAEQSEDGCAETLEARETLSSVGSRAVCGGASRGAAVGRARRRASAAGDGSSGEGRSRGSSASTENYVADSRLEKSKKPQFRDK